jgi:hypothetical protein
MNQACFPEVRIGEPTRCGVLAVYPLYPERTLFGDDALDYLLSDEAQRTGLCAVRELAEPKVGEVLVENTGDRPVLFLEGEELVGAKQNRTVLASVLVGAKSQVVLPVFCVEHGRWDPTPKNLKTGAHAPPSMRCLFKGGSHVVPRHGSRQVEVWRFITSKHMATGTSSPTENMSDIFLEHRAVVQELRRDLQCPEGASGIAATIDGRTVGIDLFDKPETLKKVWERLVVMGFTLDFLDLRDTDRLADDQQKPVRVYMDSVKDMSWQEFPTVGAGKMYRATGSDSLAAALVVDETLLHLSISVPTRH